MDPQSDPNRRVLIIRRFPQEFTVKDIEDFLNLFDPIKVLVAPDKSYTTVQFSSFDHARDVMVLLHQYALHGKLLTVEYGRTLHQLARGVECVENWPIHLNSSVSDPVKRLYATAEHLDLMQPPPPHLTYKYPPATRDIIDAISIALECSPKFYTQVVHLMNRMNLDPPFMPSAMYKHTQSTTIAADNCSRSTRKCRDIGVQTDTPLDRMEQKIKLKRQRKNLASEESELSSNESNDGNRSDHEAGAKSNKQSKRSLVQTRDIVRTKVRKILKNQHKLKKGIGQTKTKILTPSRDRLFDLSVSELRQTTMKIEAPLNLPTPKPNNIEKSVTTNDEEESTNTPEIGLQLMSDADIHENRIPAEQMAIHPMFQNYAPGTPSNKLYIKNVAKDVTVDHLKALYHRYLDENSGENNCVRDIDIRLMTSGRMKGQAFITFIAPYLDDDNGRSARLIERARYESNGLILKTKPIVVVYGKMMPKS